MHAPPRNFDSEAALFCWVMFGDAKEGAGGFTWHATTRNFDSVASLLLGDVWGIHAKAERRKGGSRGFYVATWCKNSLVGDRIFGKCTIWNYFCIGNQCCLATWLLLLIFIQLPISNTMNRLLFLLLLCLIQSSVAQPISWITDCADKSFCLNQGSCTQGAVYLVEKAVTNCGSFLINYSYKVDLNNDGSVDLQSSEDTVRGNFALGTHRVTWRASDNCANVIQCTYLITIKDCAGPNLLCINGLTQTLSPPQCDATFQVNQFILSLTDNCTPTNQIERGIRRAGTGTGFPTEQSLSFGICDDGLNLLEVWVRDANGLTNSCSNYAIVQTSSPACACNEDSDLGFSGCARAANGTRLPNYRAQTTITALPGAPSPFSKVKTVQVADSCFSLQINQVPFGADYQAVIRADRHDAPLNGVTTFDLVLISKHILGIESLDNAYQMKAADVNNSNSITTFDIVETRKLILGIYDSFPLVPAWKMVKPLANPAVLSNFTAIQDTYQVLLPNLQADLSFPGFEFVGIKYGDINYSATYAINGDERSGAKALSLNAANPHLRPGEEATIAFGLGDEEALEGWQLALSADPSVLQLLSVDGLPEENYLLFDNALRALAYDHTHWRGPSQPIFTLSVRALQPVKLSQALHLNTAVLQPEAYLSEKNGAPQRRPIVCQFGEKTPPSCSVSPNPFSDQVDFHVALETSGPALLELFTVEGKCVYSARLDLDEGPQSVRVTTNSLPPGSVFLYRFSMDGALYTGKIVRD